MMNLTEYRRTASHLADYLPWAALAATQQFVTLSQAAYDALSPSQKADATKLYLVT